MLSYHNIYKISTFFIKSRYRSKLLNISSYQNKFNCYSTHETLKNINILGIETSCDDTGAAVVNGYGQILGEGFYSQIHSSLKLGGVVPSIARKYHAERIEQAVNKAMKESGLTPPQLTAVAATVKPGIQQSLLVGSEFGKSLALKHNLPFIPIHHMEAHALTVRMENKVDFPFVVLLVSGGHCLLAVSHAIHKWTIIGQTLDKSPGCIFDKVARRIKLANLPGMSDICGGKAIEEMAKGGDPNKFSFPNVLRQKRNAQFSFSGMESYAMNLIVQLEKENEIEGGRVIAEAKDVCASFQHCVVKHIVRRTHVGLKFLDKIHMIPEQNKTLVISGGVSANNYLRRAFEALCQKEGYRLLIPPPKLCTDNGIMVAWNGVERWTAGEGVLHDKESISAISIEHKCPLGPDITSQFHEERIPKPVWTKI